MAALHDSHCITPSQGLRRLQQAEIKDYLRELPEWNLTQGGNTIERRFDFADYYRTIAFVNALAWIAHREDHHPDLEVGYNRCLVRYTTHAVNGLSLNDFICAARADTLTH